MDEEIKVGYFIMKPVETQEQCDQYSAMATQLNTHNSVAAPGDALWAIDDKEDRYEIIESGTVPTVEASHPLQWTDGKYYSVTSEKQALLTSNLSLYQLAVSNGQTFQLKWNTTGNECTEWEYEDLAALAMAIGTYVQPFVARQQELEIAIKACTTMKELDAIEINYDPVLEQYLETAGLKEVVE